MSIELTRTEVCLISFIEAMRLSKYSFGWAVTAPLLWTAQILADDSGGRAVVYWKQHYKPVGFDSWAHSHMGRALVALYDATREQRVLDALVKVYADYPSRMGTLELGGEVSGLCNLDPMLETYSFSLAKALFEQEAPLKGRLAQTCTRGPQPTVAIAPTRPHISCSHG